MTNNNDVKTSVRKEPHMLTIEQVENIRNAHEGEGGIKSWNVDDINDLCDLALTALTTPSSGWKLVPELPTVEMCNAGENAISSGRHGLQINVASVYRAMLNASPTVEVEG